MLRAEGCGAFFKTAISGKTVSFVGYAFVDDTDIIAHGDFVEEQRYLAELEPYQYGRNRTLFPWMPAWEDRPDIEMMRYGGIEPTITVGDWETYRFTLGH